MSHKDAFEQQFGWLRASGATNIEKFQNYTENDPNYGIADNLEMTEGGLVCLTKPIEEMTRLEATKALLGVARLKTTNREGLMQNLMDKAQLPESTYYQIRAAQYDYKKVAKINPEKVLKSLNDPDPWEFKKEKVVRSKGGNEIRIDSQHGVFADIGVATLKHDSDLKKALKCAVQGDGRGLRQALRGSMYVRRNYSSQLKEIAEGRLHVTPDTLKFLGITDQSAGNVVIDGDTGEVEDPYSNQFKSNWWE